ncbi:RND transporter [Phycisphaerae bacterium]|nr:RND transporter [Phycisphaerae bacterium]
MNSTTIPIDETPRRRLVTPLAVLAAAVMFAGCQSTPRADVDAARSAGEAAGLSAPIEFIAVGPDGGPLDESNAAGDALTLADALRRAVTTDPGLQAAMARVRIALADADQSRLLPNPVLNVVLRWGPGKPQIEASLAQDFVQALQIPRRSSAADNRLRQTAADAVTVAIDVASEVQERYATAQASAELVPLLRDRMVLLERLAAVAQSRLDAREGTRSDLATLEAQLVELQVEVDQAVLSEREERLRLARLIGEPSSAAGWTLDPWTAPGTDLQPESRWVDTALLRRPEIQAIAWKLKALGDDEAIVRLLPWEGANGGVDATRDDEWFAGPSVSTPLPIFDMGQAKRARVTAEQLEARHELTLARRKVVEEVRVAYQTMTASNANLARIRNQLIPLQQQRRTLAEDAYRAGQSDVTALFLAEQDLQLTQAKAIEVERQASTAFVRLQRAVGGPGVALPLMAAPTSAMPVQPDPTAGSEIASPLSALPPPSNR